MGAVHLCIDMQEGEAAEFLPDEWQRLSWAVQYLSDELEKRDVPTLYIASIDGYECRACTFNETPREILDVFKRNSDYCFSPQRDAEDLVAYKGGYSAYEIPELVSLLKEMGFSTVILSGVFEAESKLVADGCCVTMTARDFHKAGFDVIIAAEGTDAAWRGLPASLVGRRLTHLGWCKIKRIDDILSPDGPVFNKNPRPKGRLRRAFDRLAKLRLQ